MYCIVGSRIITGESSNQRTGDTVNLTLPQAEQQFVTENLQVFAQAATTLL